MAGKGESFQHNFTSVRLSTYSSHDNILNTVLVDVLDGAMVTMAIYTLNFTHPGFLLRDSLSDARSSHPSLVPDEEKRQPTPLMSED